MVWQLRRRERRVKEKEEVEMVVVGCQQAKTRIVIFKKDLWGRDATAFYLFQPGTYNSRSGRNALRVTWASSSCHLGLSPPGVPAHPRLLPCTELPSGYPAIINTNKHNKKQCTFI